MKTMPKKIWLIAAILMLTISLLVWPLYRGEAQKKNDTISIRKDDGNENDDHQDSTKHKHKHYGNGGADEQVRIAQQQVDIAMKQLEKAMKQLQKQDFSKINESVSK